MEGLVDGVLVEVHRLDIVLVVEFVIQLPMQSVVSVLQLSLLLRMQVQGLGVRLREMGSGGRLGLLKVHAGLEVAKSCVDLRMGLDSVPDELVLLQPGELTVHGVAILAVVVMACELSVLVHWLARLHFQDEVATLGVRVRGVERA